MIEPETPQVAVIGGGVMGAGIAQVFLAAGLPVGSTTQRRRPELRCPPGSGPASTCSICRTPVPSHC